MAYKRPSMPSVEDIKSTSAPSRSKEWLDELLSQDTVKDDPKFEVDDSSALVLTTTNSTNPDRPRTLKAGYDYGTNTMTVVFRDGTWWQYNSVPMDMWEDFKAATSKGKFLRDSGLDSWPDMGPADVGSMPRHRRVQMNELSKFADTLYKQNKD